MQPWPRVARVAAFLVAVAAAVYGIKQIYDPVIAPALEVATPFLIAIVLAFLLDPLADLLQVFISRVLHRALPGGASRDFAVALVGIMFLIVFLLAGFLLIPRISEQAQDLAHNYDRYASDARKAVDGVLRAHATLLHRLHLPTDAQGMMKKYSSALGGFAAGAVAVIAGVFSAILSKIMWLIIIPLATMWFLRDLDYIKAKIVHFTPELHRDRLVEISTAVGGVFGKYVRGMLTVAILFSLVTMLVLTLAGLQYGLIIGAVAGLFYLIPYVGVGIIATITAFAGLVQPHHGPEYAILLAVYLLVQSFVVFDLFVTPKVVGGSVGVHPVLALFSLALGAKLFGVIGMVVAVPVAASLQVAIGQVFPRVLDKIGSQPSQKQTEETKESSAGGG